MAQPGRQSAPILARPGLQAPLASRSITSKPEGDLVEALADAVAARLAATSVPVVEGALLNQHEAGALLSVPPSWLLAEARAGRVPHVRLGRYVRFRRDDLEAWVEARVTGPRRRTSRNPVSDERSSR